MRKPLLFRRQTTAYDTRASCVWLVVVCLALCMTVDLCVCLSLCRLVGLVPVVCLCVYVFLCVCVCVCVCE